MTDYSRLRVLVVTRSYPSADNLYQYPFVHRRVLAYQALGLAVAVFRPASHGPATRHVYEGVECISGGAGDLAATVAAFAPDVIAAHGFDEAMWAVLEPLAGRVPIRAWLHGSEIPEIHRQKARTIADFDERAAALHAVDRRCAFWLAFLDRMPARFGLVFVSHASVGLARIDWGDRLDRWAVIPNPIDTDLFRYMQKVAADRFAVLMIRPFDSDLYGNDLAVAAIADLSRRPHFDRFRFTIVGDGPHYHRTVAPLRGLRNIRFEQRFLTQPEIARFHAGHGIFLVPTRMDTQGVSRDEAMSSGLVPVTNAVHAVPEFADTASAVLAPAEDAGALTDGMTAMADDPRLFLRRSAAAAARVRAQSGKDIVMPLELAHLAAAASG